MADGTSPHQTSRVDYPAQTLITHLFIPLRRRLQCQQSTLQALLSMLDGVLINYIAVCLASAKNKAGKDALVVGWNVEDTTVVVAEEGLRFPDLHPVVDPAFDLTDPVDIGIIEKAVPTVRSLRFE